MTVPYSRIFCLVTQSDVLGETLAIFAIVGSSLKFFRETYLNIGQSLHEAVHFLAHNVVDKGKPVHFCANEIMLKTMLNYKRISRWVIRNLEKLSSDRMASALLRNI